MDGHDFGNKHLGPGGECLELMLAFFCCKEAS